MDTNDELDDNWCSRSQQPQHEDWGKGCQIMGSSGILLIFQYMGYGTFQRIIIQMFQMNKIQVNRLNDLIHMPYIITIITMMHIVKKVWVWVTCV